MDQKLGTAQGITEGANIAPTPAHIRAEPAHFHALPDPPSLASATADAPETTPPAPGEAKGGTVTTGAKIHKWGTYLSVDWIFNTATGVSFAYWGKYTDTGKKFWSGPVTDAFTKALKPLIKDPAQLKKSAGYGNMFMSIIAGGMFTIPPLMALENNKVKKNITEFFDNMIYGKDKVANDPEIQASYKEIENAPKKDFFSGLTSRFTALAPLLAIVLIPTTKKIGNKMWFNHVEAASEFTAAKAGLSAEKVFAKLPAAEAKDRWKFIHESVAMDFGLGIPYAILHAVFYNKYANSKAQAKAEETPANAVEAKPADTTTVDAPVKKWTAQVEKKETPSAQIKLAQNFAERMSDKGNLERQLV